MTIDEIKNKTLREAVRIGFNENPEKGKSRICGYANDEGVMLIAEINLKELPEECGLSGEGYLQFYIDAGLDIGRQMDSGGNCRVVLADTPFDETGMFEMTDPIVKPSGISFEECMESISPADVRLTEMLSTEEIAEHWNEFESGNGSKIFGYPFFTQQDPRESDTKYDTLLLQLDSDNESIMWGDCGTGNFFINSKKLKEKDFNDVLFYWDCF